MALSNPAYLAQHPELQIVSNKDAAYYAIPKADGGYDFYKVSSGPNGQVTGMTTISYKDLNTETGWEPKADTTTGSTSAGTSGPTAAQISAVQEQAVPLFQQFIQSLQKKYGDAKAQVEKSWKDAMDTLVNDYWDNANTNDKNFGQGLKGVQNAYAGRGLGDSSYKDNAIADQRGNFYDNLSRLDRAKTTGENSLNEQRNAQNMTLNDQMSQDESSANAQLQNMINPTRPTFGDFASLSSYYSQLGSKAPAIKGISPVKLTADTTPYYNAVTAGNKAVQPTGVGNMSKEDLQRWLYPQI